MKIQTFEINKSTWAVGFVPNSPLYEIIQLTCKMGDVPCGEDGFYICPSDFARITLTDEKITESRFANLDAAKNACIEGLKKKIETWQTALS